MDCVVHYKNQSLAALLIASFVRVKGVRALKKQVAGWNVER
jgi:hypothetical protein